MRIEKKQDVHCVCCGVRTGLLTREKLSKGECLCLKCQHRLPTIFYDNFKHLSAVQYDELLTYIDEETPKLAEIFNELHSYSALRLDTVNGILMYKSCNAPDLYLKVENITSFRLNFLPEKSPSEGRVDINLACQHPHFFIDTSINYHETEYNDVIEFMKHYEFMVKRLESSSSEQKTSVF